MLDCPSLLTVFICTKCAGEGRREGDDKNQQQNIWMKGAGIHDLYFLHPFNPPTFFFFPFSFFLSPHFLLHHITRLRGWGSKICVIIVKPNCHFYILKVFTMGGFFKRSIQFLRGNQFLDWFKCTYEANIALIWVVGYACSFQFSEILSCYNISQKWMK